MKDEKATPHIKTPSISTMLKLANKVGTKLNCACCIDIIVWHHVTLHRLVKFQLYTTVDSSKGSVDFDTWDNLVSYANKLMENSNA